MKRKDKAKTVHTPPMLGVILGVGLFVRIECSTIPNPTPWATFCFETSTNTVRAWDGKGWAVVKDGPEAQRAIETVRTELLRLRSN